METESNFLKNLPIELTYALYRVAEPMRHQELKSRIETWSVTFLESSLLSDMKSIARDIHMLEHMIILGEAVGEIPYYSSEILRVQFEKIKSAMRQYNEERIAALSIKDLFADSVETNNGDFSSVPHRQKADFPLNIGHIDKRNDLETSIGRRNIIVEKIRQLGNAAMKDIVAAFPSVSERTLRYDLRKLCERAVLERVGNGGPASFYRPKEISAAVN